MLKKFRFCLFQYDKHPLADYTHQIEFFFLPDYKAAPDIGDVVKHKLWVMLKFDTFRFLFLKNLKGFKKFKIFPPIFKMHCGRGYY